ncbi:hypothetical protein SVI_4051 [Shewanella violacea DSS12]|uniref:Uncharacterized protein n=1 Tax=Shewanella violacea (strain JCM 10179 / CIP 106290 / LMG 19151 / DSS12) TaxID=637905 RepID=D4ZDW1_SHEVD|nr:hypothetical protein SVI_4051 [Shewanella violacea DSS12]
MIYNYLFLKRIISGDTLGKCMHIIGLIENESGFI